ncbi:MAG: ArsR/SmtB family transcription factor [Faecalibacterium sp.]
MEQELRQLAQEFESCRGILLALGDENRQHLILEMMQMNRCDGARVGEITQRTHLSRPAVSHHLRILRQAGILKMRREGTRNYYYLDADHAAMDCLLQMLRHAAQVMDTAHSHSGGQQTLSDEGKENDEWI